MKLFLTMLFLCIVVNQAQGCDGFVMGCASYNPSATVVENDVNKMTPEEKFAYDYYNKYGVTLDAAINSCCYGLYSWDRERSYNPPHDCQILVDKGYSTENNCKKEETNTESNR